MNVDKKDRFYMRAISASSIGLWEFNLKTKELKWSDEMYNIYGKQLKKSELNHNSWFNCLHPDDIGRERKNLLLTIKRRQAYDSTFRIIWPDGSIKYIKAQASIEHNNNGTESRIIGTNFDVTASVEDHHALYTSKKEFEGAFKHSAIGMALVSLEGKWLRVNQQVSEITGYSADELMKLTFQDITHPDDLDKDLGLVKKMIDKEIETYQIEKRYIHKQGHEIWILLSVSIVVDNLERPLYFVSQIKDITENKIARLDLEKNVRITQRQNDRLLNFAHIVSHNLRSHTGNLSMILNLLDEEENTDKAQALLGHIKQISSSLTSTVQHLTEVVKIQTDSELKIKELDLFKYVNRALSTITADILKNEVTVNNRITNGINVYFNPAYLDSVLLNLLTNCIKYRSPERKLQITIDAGSEGHRNYFSIEDNGLGIDLNKHRKKLFGLHETFHNHKDSRGEGLFITKNQIDAFGGEIDVRSEPNEGTIFKIYLPNEN